MRRLRSLLLVPFLSGCLNTQFVGAVDAAWQVIGPEYIEYVKKDPNLDAESKVTRARTADLLTETILEAQK